MKSIASIRARLDRLLEAQAAENEPPACVVLLPDNGRGPDADTRPLPRATRVGKVLVVTFDADMGQPDAATLAALVKEAS